MKKYIGALLLLALFVVWGFLLYSQNQTPRSVMKPAITASGASKENIETENFMQSFTGLLSAKDEASFLVAFQKQKSQIDSLIVQGSGGVFYAHKKTDTLLPFIYLCGMTRSGNDVEVRKLMQASRSILPTKQISMPPEIQAKHIDFERILDEFFEKKITLKELYSKTLQIFGEGFPVYYKDLLSERISTLGKPVDDCGERIQRYDWF